MVIDNYKRILDEMKKYADKYSRDINDISVLPISKGKLFEDMIKLTEIGINKFGESRVQEATIKLDKFNELKVGVEYHFIGNVQSNKIKKMVSMFDVIQSVDNINSLLDINNRAFAINKVQNILIQLNLADEEQKGGVSEDNINLLLEKLEGYSNVKLTGFMVIPPKSEELTKLTFERAKVVFDKYKKNLGLDTLSMGMSSDLELAIANGSTMLRVGTAIFNSY